MKFKTVTVGASDIESAQVLEMLQDKYDIRGAYGPELRMDLDEFPMIIWEGGPFDWDIELSCGMADKMPEGVWVEPINCYSVRVFKDVPNTEI